MLKLVEYYSSKTKPTSSVYLSLNSSICTTPLYRNLQFLNEKYITEGLSIRQIAVLIGCRHSTINRALESFGISKTSHKGGWPGYGVKINGGKRVPHTTQQAIIARINRWRLRGWSYNEIANKLNNAGQKTSTGKLWHGANIARMVRKLK